MEFIKPTYVYPLGCYHFTKDHLKEFDAIVSKTLKGHKDKGRIVLSLRGGKQVAVDDFEEAMTDTRLDNETVLHFNYSVRIEYATLDVKTSDFFFSDLTISTYTRTKELDEIFDRILQWAREVRGHSNYHYALRWFGRGLMIYAGIRFLLTFPFPSSLTSTSKVDALLVCGMYFYGFFLSWIPSYVFAIGKGRERIHFWINYTKFFSYTLPLFLLSAILSWVIHKVET